MIYTWIIAVRFRFCTFCNSFLEHLTLITIKFLDMRFIYKHRGHQGIHSPLSGGFSIPRLALVVLVGLASFDFALGPSEPPGGAHFIGFSIVLLVQITCFLSPSLRVTSGANLKSCVNSSTVSFKAPTMRLSHPGDFLLLWLIAALFELFSCRSRRMFASFSVSLSSQSWIFVEAEISSRQCGSR